jgi:hypothetical protein
MACQTPAMRGRTIAVLGLSALLVFGCAATPGHRPQAAQHLKDAQPPPSSTASSYLVVEPYKNTEPDVLRVGVVIEGTEDGGDVATRMWTHPTFAPGFKDYPRAVELDLAIANNAGPPLRIKAAYKAGDRPAESVPTGGCRGTRRLPTVIASGAEVDGCLGYLIPGDAGRLVLSGNSNFNVYVPIRSLPN